MTGENASICNDCVADAARKMGMLLPPEPGDGSIAIADELPTSFVHRMELPGHPDQPYDMFLVQCLLDRLRAKYWNISIETARITRSDGFIRDGVAEGRAKYVIELLVRSHDMGPALNVQAELAHDWSEFLLANEALIGDKGTRDLLDPRLRSLGSYVSRRADRVCS
jgi:hypothetical protein